MLNHLKFSSSGWGSFVLVMVANLLWLTKAGWIKVLFWDDHPPLVVHFKGKDWVLRVPGRWGTPMSKGSLQEAQGRKL